MPHNDEVADLLAGKAALEGLAGELAGLDTSGAKVPRVEVAGMVRHVLAQVTALKPLQGEIKAQVSDANGLRVERALERLPQLGRALIYAQTRHKAAESAQVAPERAFEVVSRWRGAMLSTLDTLTALGHVGAAQATYIRSGRGALDAARDAVELTAIYDDKWSVVEPLQALHSDPAQRITRALLVTLQEAALGFIEAAESADALRPAEVQLRAWEETLKGLMVLLEQSWDALRHAARYAHDNDAIHMDLDELASAYALSRRG